MTDSQSTDGGNSDNQQVARERAALVDELRWKKFQVLDDGFVCLVDVMGDDAAVVVEQPWMRVMEHFPPALYRHRFGT